MITTANGSLVIVGLNTPAPQVFWNGTEVAGVVSIRSEWEHDERHIKLRVKGTDDALYMELVAAGIQVKKVTK